jgi:hypothetical protein
MRNDRSAPLIALRRDADRNSAAVMTHARRASIESSARRLPLFNPRDIYAHHDIGVTVAASVRFSQGERERDVFLKTSVFSRKKTFNF